MISGNSEKLGCKESSALLAGFSEQEHKKQMNRQVINNFKISHNCQIRKTPFLKSSFSTGYVTLFWMTDCDTGEIEINFNLLL
mgnify:CR=1 FL=1